MKYPTIYLDITIMQGCYSLSLLCFKKWCLFDIKFSNEINQIVLFNTELYFKYKGEK